MGLIGIITNRERFFEKERKIEIFEKFEFCPINLSTFYTIVILDFKAVEKIKFFEI